MGAKTANAIRSLLGMRRLVGLAFLAVAVVAMLGYDGGADRSPNFSVRAPLEETRGCDPNYVGACLDPNAYDYDCEGGSGDGPEYTWRVTVVGSDHYGLDADGDEIGCER
jgi:hypothetical protein